MAGRVITITSGKGGVGKTTVTGNLAVALAQMGSRVCCIDLDIGLRNLDLILGLENRVVYDVVDVIEGRVRLRQALVRDRRLEGLHLLPAAQWREKHAIHASQLVKLTKDLCADFDVVLIDSPAGIEIGFRNAIASASEILLVATPEVSSIRDADRVIELLREAGKPAPTLIMNRVRPAMIKKGDMLDVADVLEILKIDLLGIVPEDPSIIANTNTGTPTVLFNTSPAGSAISRIARRLMGDDVPIVTEESRNWFDRLANVLGQSRKTGMG